MWIPAFVGSIERAIGQNVTYKLDSTVNPLVYKIQLSWKEPTGAKIAGGVWNLFEKWVSKNDADTSGGVEIGPTGMAMHLVTKRRLGPPKDSVPW